MRKTFKTILALLMVLATLFSITGCSATTKAEMAVNGMFRSFKKLDFDAAEAYVDVDAFNLSELGNDLSGKTKLFMRYLFAKMDYEVISSEQIDENTVVVHTKVTAVAFAPVLTKFVAQWTQYNLSNILANPKPTDEEKEEKMEQILKEIISKEDLKMKTSEVAIQVVQQNGKWRVSSTDTLVDALFGGIGEALSDGIADLLT